MPLVLGITTTGTQTGQKTPNNPKKPPASSARPAHACLPPVAQSTASSPGCRRHQQGGAGALSISGHRAAGSSILPPAARPPSVLVFKCSAFCNRATRCASPRGRPAHRGIQGRQQTDGHRTQRQTRRGRRQEQREKLFEKETTQAAHARKPVAPPSKAQTKLRGSPSSPSNRKSGFSQIHHRGEGSTACERQNTRMRFLRSPEAAGAAAGSSRRSKNPGSDAPRAARVWRFPSQTPRPTQLRAVN